MTLGHRCTVCDKPVRVPENVAWLERCPHCYATPLNTRQGESMPNKPRLAPSEQFREAAEMLSLNTTTVLQLQTERDDTEIMVGKLKGLLVGAEAELAVRERALSEYRQLIGPQAALHLTVMRDVAGAAKEEPT